MNTRLWTLSYWSHLDGALCRGANRWCMDGRWVWRYFAAVSRLGDGLIWYALMLGLCLAGSADTALRMALAGIAGLCVYRAIKTRSRRPRPLHADPRIVARVPPLDRYSFPSGHTLHATTFTLIASHAHPGLAVLLVPLALSIAASRVLLGLHYPSDVLIGAVLGLGLARLALTF
ncbi:MAG: phosphatase PAP2 family protein [Xanthomonadales bacterium]|jgi:undecaprenyl-diphosphatase|nr:phosphatase PAP2 family protein [Xanthomonadales bacterium]